MGKYGNQVNVKTNLNKFMISVMGPSGFGKTTLMYKVCEKEFGSDGYIIFDMGREEGTAALQGVIAEKIENWKKMKEVVDDIVKNKETDYPNLKVVVFDTLDETFTIAEQYAIATYNRENIGHQGFIPATSINSVEGGFGKGLDKVIEYVRKEITRLNSVGVGVWWTAHVKEKDQTDLFSGAAYTTLTANMSMKYFNSIKNISHVVAFGYFDRSIKKTEIGEANPFSKKKKERKEVVDETRKILFRDSALVADAKSRFSHIVEGINLDPDEFIKAIKDAIEAERNSSSIVTPTPAVATSPSVELKPDDTEEVDIDEAPFDIEEPVDIDALFAEIRGLFHSADAGKKAAVKAILTEKGSGKLDSSLSADVLTEIKNILTD